MLDMSHVMPAKTCGKNHKCLALQLRALPQLARTHSPNFVKVVAAVKRERPLLNFSLGTTRFVRL